MKEKHLGKNPGDLNFSPMKPKRGSKAVVWISDSVPSVSKFRRLSEGNFPSLSGAISNPSRIGILELVQLHPCS